MRVSVSLAPSVGTCTRCGAGGLGDATVTVIVFAVVVEGHAGDADALCRDCLFDPGGLRVDVPMANLAPGPAPRRAALRRAKKVSRAQEQDVAEALGGYTQPGSGNMPGAKGDVRVKGRLRVETKFTKAGSFSLKLEELYKIAHECHGLEKPVFVIDYLDPGTSKLQDRFAVVPFQDLKELLNASGQHR